MDATIAVEKNSFFKEESEFLKDILSLRFFEIWKNPNLAQDENFEDLRQESRLELYITSTCNQHCEYCYLWKYPEIYPSEINKSEQILKNLGILLDWMIENEFFIPEIDLFTGEIWHSSFGLQILDLIYEKIQAGFRCGSFIVPSNCSFLNDKRAWGEIQRRINKFKDIGCPLVFSISVDGAVVEKKARPKNNGFENLDKFYDNMFIFAKHNNFKFHPMVAACDIEDWIENYHWWEQMCQKYDISTDWLMMLEVRNADWTQDKIQAYNNFMDYLIDKEVKKYGSSQKFFEEFYSCASAETRPDLSYVPYLFSDAESVAGCTVGNTLTVRLGDLAICPCHRTAYHKLIYGKFKVENDKIVDIIGNNPAVATRILLANNLNASLKCDTCRYKGFCLQGCFGSQIEATGDPFMPIPSVCEFFSGKIDHLVQKYISMGFLDYLLSIKPGNDFYPRAQVLLDKIGGICKCMV